MQYKQSGLGSRAWSTPVSLLSCTVLDLQCEDRSVQCLRVKAILPQTLASSESHSDVHSCSPEEIIWHIISEAK